MTEHLLRAAVAHVRNRLDNLERTSNGPRPGPLLNELGQLQSAPTEVDRLVRRPLRAAQDAHPAHRGGGLIDDLAEFVASWRRAHSRDRAGETVTNIAEACGVTVVAAALDRACNLGYWTDQVTRPSRRSPLMEPLEIAAFCPPLQLTRIAMKSRNDDDPYAITDHRLRRRRNRKLLQTRHTARDDVATQLPADDQR